MECEIYLVNSQNLKSQHFLRPRNSLLGRALEELVELVVGQAEARAERRRQAHAHPGGAAARFAAQEVRGERRRRRWRVRSLRTTRFRQCGKQWIFRAVALAHACVSTSSVFGVRGAVDRVTVVPIAVALFDCW